MAKFQKRFCHFFCWLFFTFVVITDKSDFLSHLGDVLHGKSGDFKDGIIFGSYVFDVSLQVSKCMVVIGHVDVILICFHSLEIHYRKPHQCDEGNINDGHRTFYINIGQQWYIRRISPEGHQKQ
jgi:hypothetical protein